MGSASLYGNLGTLPPMRSKGKAPDEGLRGRSPPKKADAYFTGKSQDFNEMKLIYYSCHIFYLKNQLYYRLLLFTYRAIGLCQGRKEGLGTCPTSSCIENSLPPPPLKNDIIVGPFKLVLLFMLLIFRL